MRAYCALFFLKRELLLEVVCDVFFINNINESLFSIKNDVFKMMML